MKKKNGLSIKDLLIYNKLDIILQNNFYHKQNTVIQYLHFYKGIYIYEH